MHEVMIIEAARTPIGDFLGALSKVPAVDLGVHVTKAVLDRAGIKPEQVQEVVAGMVYKEGVKGNPARQIQIKAGIPVEGYASTVDQQCSSGMRAMEMLSQQIILGKTEIGVAVGIENMSQAPHLMLGARNGYRMGGVTIEDSLTYDALYCAMCGYHMGITAENLAEKYNITRQEQDELALMSHHRAAAAQKECKFADEIVPVEIADRKGTKVVAQDEHVRAELTMESLAKLKPAFKKDGTVTAGNASGINDGASALLLMSREKCEQLGLKPVARILSTASHGVEPKYMGIGPVFAIPKALKYAGLELKDIDYFEINEAFAAQFIACNRELKLDMNKVNANGSGIALGHPVGSTGIRIIVSMLSEMKRRQAKYGVASLCVGGGPAMATVIEKI